MAQEKDFFSSFKNSKQGIMNLKNNFNNHRNLMSLSKDRMQYLKTKYRKSKLNLMTCRLIMNVSKSKVIKLLDK